MADFPLLKTARLTLRELTMEDAPDLLGIHGDADAMKWFGSDPITRIDQAEQLVELFASWRSAPSPGIRWGIEDSTGNLIGTCGLFKWNRSWKSCSIGFELAQAAQRKGFMREAIVAGVQWGLSHMQLNRIDALVHPDNVRSLTLLQGIGFVCEGTLRQAGFWGNSYHDLNQLSLLHSEFNAGDAIATSLV
jgi:ribosomal-protein-alanine N-acetyltransferase